MVGGAVLGVVSIWGSNSPLVRGLVALATAVPIDYNRLLHETIEHSPLAKPFLERGYDELGMPRYADLDPSQLIHFLQQRIGNVVGEADVMLQLAFSEGRKDPLAVPYCQSGTFTDGYLYQASLALRRIVETIREGGVDLIADPTSFTGEGVRGYDPRGLQRGWQTLNRLLDNRPSWWIPPYERTKAT